MSISKIKGMILGMLVGESEVGKNRRKKFIEKLVTTFFENVSDEITKEKIIDAYKKSIPFAPKNSSFHRIVDPKINCDDSIDFIFRVFILSIFENEEEVLKDIHQTNPDDISQFCAYIIHHLIKGIIYHRPFEISSLLTEKEWEILSSSTHPATDITKILIEYYIIRKDFGFDSFKEQTSSLKSRLFYYPILLGFFGLNNPFVFDGYILKPELENHIETFFHNHLIEVMEVD